MNPGATQVRGALARAFTANEIVWRVTSISPDNSTDGGFVLPRRSSALPDTTSFVRYWWCIFHRRADPYCVFIHFVSPENEQCVTLHMLRWKIAGEGSLR